MDKVKELLEVEKNKLQGLIVQLSKKPSIELKEMIAEVQCNIDDLEEQLMYKIRLTRC